MNSNTLLLGHEGPGSDVAIMVKVGHHNAEGWVVFESTYYTYLSSGFKVRPMALLWRKFYGAVPLVVTFISISYRETWKVSVVILAPKVTLKRTVLTSARVLPLLEKR